MFEPAADLQPRKRVIDYEDVDDVPVKVEPPVPPVIYSIYQSWTDELNDIIQRACAPLLTALGAVAAKLRIDDVRKLMVYDAAKPDPYSKLAVVQWKNATTLQQWVEANAFLGPVILGLYIQSITTEQWKHHQQTPNKVTACLDIRILDRGAIPERDTLLRATQERVQAAAQVVQVRENAFQNNPTNQNRIALDEASETFLQLQSQMALQDDVHRVLALLGNQENELLFAPAWAFGVMPEAVFTKFISPTAWGAIKSAVGWIQRLPNCSSYTLKELVCSDGVLDHFATVVAYQFLNLGNGDGLAGNGNMKRARNYVNVNKMRDDMLVRMSLIATWFQTSVFTRPHPLLRKFDERIALLEPGDRDTLMVYRQHLPKRMLFGRHD